jgi:hypothetical protein
LYDHDHDDENDREQAFVQYQYSHTILYLRNWASNGNEMHLVAMAMGSILYKSFTQRRARRDRPDSSHAAFSDSAGGRLELPKPLSLIQ